MSVTPVTPAAAGAAGAAGAGATQADREILQAARGFEAILLQKVVGEMFATTGGDEPGGTILGGLVTEKLADHLADTGGFGLASSLAAQLAGHRVEGEGS